VDQEPKQGAMFYMYRSNGHYMRTNVVSKITSQVGAEGVTTYEFETESGSKYRLKVDQNDLTSNLN
jgi:hypothetical protein